MKVDKESKLKKNILYQMAFLLTFIISNICDSVQKKKEVLLNQNVARVYGNPPVFVNMFKQMYDGGLTLVPLPISREAPCLHMYKLIHDDSLILVPLSLSNKSFQNCLYCVMICYVMLFYKMFCTVLVKLC